MATLVLVACGDSKQDDPAPAKELYTSTYFAKKRAVAELLGDADLPAGAWRIYSAKHGLVAPDAEIAPYDASLRPDDAAFIGAEAVADLAAEVATDLRWLVATADVDEVLVLAGRAYAEPLRDALGAWASDTVRYPFEGLGGLPGQMRWLSDQLDAHGEGSA